MNFVVSLLIKMLGVEGIASKVLTDIALKNPKFASILKKATKLKELHQKFSKVLNYIDPEYLLGELLKLPKKEIAKYLKFKKTDYQRILKDFKIQESSLKGDLTSLKASFEESYNDYMNGGTETGWVNLSSSWIQRGIYNRIGNTNNGILTIFIRSDKDSKQRLYGPYVYPLIPIEVWTAMSKAKGKNGSGAGSVFWKLWLRKWLDSYLRDHTYKKLIQTYGSLDSQTYKRLPNTNQISQLIREQQELVKKAQSGYYRTTAANRAYRGFDSYPVGNKPFSVIDNPTYLKQRQIIQQNQYSELTRPIRETQANLNQVRESIQSTRGQLTNARNNLRNFNSINRIVRKTKQVLNKGPISTFTNDTIKKPIRKKINKSIKDWKGE